MRAVRPTACGGPEVLTVREVPDPPPPGPGAALVRVRAAGVNFIDIYHRTGLYPSPFPIEMGMEGAGTVEAVGPDVTDLAPGDRVAFAGIPGAYAEKIVAPAARLVKIPDTVDFDPAAAVMLQGMTAHYLTHTTYPLRPGETCVVHAAAGGAGALIVQMAKARGARVIGTVSTEAKAAIAREAGADEVLLYGGGGGDPRARPWPEEVRRLTGGRGAEVIYDGVGRPTFEPGLGALAPRGMMVLFGQSGGAVAPFDPALLARKGSLFLTRPTLFHYIATREELLARAQDVLGAVARGALRLRIDRRFTLAEAAEAQRALESRSTAGKVLLIP